MDITQKILKAISSLDGDEKEEKYPLVRNSIKDHTKTPIIVIFKSAMAGSPMDACKTLKFEVDLETKFIFNSSIRGFAADIDETKLRYLSNQANVLRIERDHTLHAWPNRELKSSNEIKDKIFNILGSKTRKSHKEQHKDKDKEKEKEKYKNKSGGGKSGKESSTTKHKGTSQWNIPIVRKEITLGRPMMQKSKEKDESHDQIIQYPMLPVHLFIFDTGISINHPDLLIRPENRRNFVKNGNTFDLDDDLQGHSSHVAGIAGAINKSGNGVIGVAPGIQLHSVKVLDSEGNGNMSFTLAGMEFVTLEKLRNPQVPMIVNLSLGFDCKSTEYNALDEAVDRAIQVGVVVVIAAGNDGKNVATYSPAHVRRAIVVGSSSHKNGLSYSNFSNHGRGIDIIAPGSEIYSSWKKNGYKVESGTSMASPHVAAAAALFLCLHPNSVADEVKYFLLNVAKKNIIKNIPPDTPNVSLWIPDEIINNVYHLQ